MEQVVSSLVIHPYVFCVLHFGVCVCTNMLVHIHKFACT